MRSYREMTYENGMDKEKNDRDGGILPKNRKM